MWAGVAATIFGTLLGSLIGMFSGYFGGRTDLVTQRIMDSLQVLPLIVLLLVVVVALGPSLVNIIWALSIGILPAAGRIVRGATFSVKSEQYVEAARLVGATPLRILIRHIIPSILGPLIVQATFGFGGVILVEASLSFLGLGPAVPYTWGAMLAQGTTYLWRSAQLAAVPGAAIAVVVLGCNLLGDGLRDRLDPRSRGRT